MMSEARWLSSSLRAFIVHLSEKAGPTSSDLACPTLGDLDLSISEERSLSVREVFNVQLQHIPGIGKQVAGALVRAE